MPLYFAYGSNMDRAQMALRCPASSPVGPARLARHRLVIMREGYASILRDARRNVWGFLWDLAFADIPALDRYEGVGGGLYVKRHLAVLSSSGARRALVYVGRDDGPGRPRPGYLDAIVSAARGHGFSAAYLGELEALAGPRLGTRAVRPDTAASLFVGVRPRRDSPLDPDRTDAPRAWRWRP